METANSFNRRLTRKIQVGAVAIGGDSPISVQTMTKTKTADVKATLAQIKRCEEAGADIIRVTVNDKEAAGAIKDIVAGAKVPIVADIHFNHIYALKSIEAGVAKVRINPGNIGGEDRIKAVLDASAEKNLPIRIGINSGSLEKDILEKYDYPTAEALCESALRHAEIAEKLGFKDIAISVKSTSVPLTIKANRLLSSKTDYPLHLGVTEAGTYDTGIVKSSVGIGTLLAEGIGDTIRVSLTEEPEKEVIAGRNILRSLKLASSGVDVIACPTCGRLEIDLFKITREVEEAVNDIDKNLTVAILGCAVNGPGEAKEADIGVAAGKGEAILFKKGEKIRKIKESEIVEQVYKEVKKF